MQEYKYENIRNFYFENEKGESIDCQKINGGLFLYNVSGLGYEENVEYKKVGYTFVENKREMKQNQITGDLEFYDMTYDEYSNFVDFILRAKKLRLIYVPKKTARTKYYREIDFVSIPKTEEDDYNILTSTITINCLTLWYEENETIFKIEKYEDEMRYPYKWNSRYIDYNSRMIVFNNKGHVDAPIQVEISGFVQNPTISIFVNEEEYASIKIPITINEYEKLLYSSKTGEIYIQKQKTDGTKESLWKNKYVDLSKRNIFKLPLRSIRDKNNSR